MQVASLTNTPSNPNTGRLTPIPATFRLADFEVLVSNREMPEVEAIT